MAPEKKKRKIDRHTLQDSSMDGTHQLTEKMNSSEDSFVGDINRLPVEILIKIIADLPLEDRKNTRLVSRRWYDLNNIRQISTKEKFLCYGVYGLDSVLKTLENSKKDVLNIQFIFFDFHTNTDQSFEFWRNNGRKIDSLSFRYCTLSEKTMEHIIVNCDKMRYFAIKHPRMSQLCERGQKFMSGPTLEKLINIRREKLHSFHLEAFTDKYKSNEFLRLMFVIYPNIEDFSFSCSNIIYDVDLITIGEANVVLLQSDRMLTFASILKKLVDSRKVMRSINLNVAQPDLHFIYMVYDFPNAS